MTAYILLGEGFEELEAIAVCDILRRGGVDVKLAGIGKKLVSGAHGVQVMSDIMVSEVNITEKDCLIIPGGGGGVNTIENSVEAMSLVSKAGKCNAKLAAICAGPRILAQVNLLQDKKITCYPGEEPKMNGASTDSSFKCRVDGNVITGRSPGTAIDFALTLLKELGINEDVKAGLYCD